MTTTEVTPVTGVHPPLPTPMDGGAIDFESLERLVEHLDPHVDGLLYGGSISETTSLSVEERISVIEAVAADYSEELVRYIIRKKGHMARFAEAALEAEPA